MKLSDSGYFYIPLISFVVVWAIVFILKSVTEVQLYNVSFETYLIIVTSLIMFIMGYLYKWYFSNSSIPGKKEIPRQISPESYNFIFKVLVISIVIYCLSVYFHITILSEERGGWFKYIINPVMARQAVVEAGKLASWNIGLAISSYGVSLITIIGILGGILFTSQKKKFIIFSILPLFLGFSFGILTFSRYAIIQIILYWLFAVLYFSFFQEKKQREKTVRRLAVATNILVFTFVAIFYIIVSLRYFTESNKGISNTFQKQFTYYIVGNVVGLERYFDESPQLLYGKRIFNPIEKWLNRINVLHNTNPLEFRFPFTKTSNTLYINTYSYVRPLHEDFGIIGLLILSFFWGYIGFHLIDKLLNSYSLPRLYLVVVFCFSVTLSFFGLSFLNYTKIFYEFLLFILIDRAMNIKLRQNFKTL